MSGLLYALPLLCRVAIVGWRNEALGDAVAPLPPAWRVALSLGPLLLVLPSPLLPRWVPRR